MDPQPGVVVPPTRLGGPHRAPLAILAAAVATALVVALLKPWGGPAVTAPSATDGIPTAVASVGPRPVAIAAPSLTPPAVLAAALLQPDAGTWGVGVGGSGPRLTRDGPWADWSAVASGPASAVPDALADALDAGGCAGLPMLAAEPSILVVTTSGEVGSGWQLAAWWSDGRTVLALAGAVRQAGLPGERSLGYLVRLDGSTWPAGRYELHLTAGHRTYALSACVRPAAVAGP